MYNDDRPVNDHQRREAVLARIGTLLSALTGSIDYHALCRAHLDCRRLHAWAVPHTEEAAVRAGLDLRLLDLKAGTWPGSPEHSIACALQAWLHPDGRTREAQALVAALERKMQPRAIA